MLYFIQQATKRCLNEQKNAICFPMRLLAITMHRVSIFLILLWLAKSSSAQHFDDMMEDSFFSEEENGFEFEGPMMREDVDDEDDRADNQGGRSSSNERFNSQSHEHHPRPGPIQIFIPGPPPRRQRPRPQAPPPPPPSVETSTAAAEDDNADLLNALVAPTALTPAQRAARRAAYVQFMGELEDAKSQLEGLDGRWGSQIAENLVLLNPQQLQTLNGDQQGPEDPNQIFLGDGPLNLRQVQQGSGTAQQENGLQQVGRFNLDDLGASPATRQFRRKRQQQPSDVTCQEYVFDARQQWPQCADVINNVRDQSLCGDCWAVSASSAFSDRRCIQRAKRGMPIGQEDLFFSAYDTAICSDGATDAVNGCRGGSTGLAWRYYANTGIVSGGNNPVQNTSSGPQGGCKPYPFPPIPDSSEPLFSALLNQCTATCTNGSQNVNNPLRARALSWNYLYGANNSWEQTMREEIFANGSISASLQVFEDFKTYSSGIYSHVTGNLLGGHAIRLIGYGNITCSDGSSQKYWLGVNSWNTDWGMDGLFKIARGVDMCNIETRQISYGIPAV